MQEPSTQAIARQRAHGAWFKVLVGSGRPALAAHEGENAKHVTFAYALALTGCGARKVTVLDYGGGLGDYYWVARAFVPSLELDYQCKELPAIAAAGGELNPEITWHADDSCLDQAYDLIVFSSSLQYLHDWQATLIRAARSTRRYLLVSDIPTVRKTATYVAMERSHGCTNRCWQLNRDQVVRAAEEAGVRLIREFDMGMHPPVANAPEQPSCLGLLFQRG